MTLGMKLNALNVSQQYMRNVNYRKPSLDILDRTHRWLFYQWGRPAVVLPLINQVSLFLPKQNLLVSYITTHIFPDLRVKNVIELPFSILMS